MNCQTMQVSGPHIILTLLSLVQFVAKSLSGDVNPRQELYVPNYKIYHNTSSLEREIRKLVQRNQDYIRLSETYVSRNKASQLVLNLKNFTQNGRTQSTLSTSKPKVLLSYGEHAREFFPVESALYFLKNITEGISSPISSTQFKFSRNILSNLNIFMIVLANPDGRKYVERTKNYCWRGTSTGVDLDRNFDWNFAGKGSSSDPLDEEFRGHFVNSEPECAPYLKLTEQQFGAFVSFHSGIRQVYVPFADSVSAKSRRVPINLQAQLELARSLAESSSQSFRFGMGYELTGYPADGTIFDYMHGVRNIPFSLTIEMWGEGDSREKQCFDLFNPPSEKLQGALEDVMPIYETLFSFLIEWEEKKNHQYYHSLEQPDFGLPKGYIVPVLAVSLLILAVFHRHLPTTLSLRGYQRRRIISLRSLSTTFSVTSGVKIT